MEYIPMKTKQRKYIDYTPAVDPRTKEERVIAYRKNLDALKANIVKGGPNVELDVRLAVGMAELIGRMEQQIMEEQQCLSRK